ncbi:RidA family protein [Nocardia sp. NBC_01329]|uniref:RidA family protein n=1 Tax=Nocardia sp. NBC_01329 TaxID=2903594 RepID=UPI002E119C3D|nr:RidA family protein [Nocardia sp. NBC_01329]
MTTPTADIQLRNSPDLRPPFGHYSHVAVHGGLAYISGQLPVDQAGNSSAGQPFHIQARQVLDNLDKCLATAGTDRTRLVSLFAYVTDVAAWPAFDTIYAEWIGAHRPARAVVGVNELHYGSAVEIHAIAAID